MSPGKDAQTTVEAGLLAKTLAVPPSVLSFLEGQFPEVRALKSGAGRVYRAADAAFLAGLVDALYTEGRPFRDVQAAARSAERGAIMKAGAARIAEIASLPDAEPPSEAIPADALVRRRGALPDAPPSSGPPPTQGEILRELMDCVRILNAARQD
ncbi:MAG: hypothetical protein AAF615_04830 [Pseudomonadota bacterium]